MWAVKAFIFSVRFHFSFQNVIQIDDKTEPKVPAYLSLTKTSPSSNLVSLIIVDKTLIN